MGDLRQSLETYLSRKTTSIPFPDRDGSPVVAYFSLEYGISQCLPIYSGGLGILAGDHLKSASDLCVPLVGIGLCYQQGFFRQYLTPDGWQQERYPLYDFEQMPLSLCKDEAGERVMVHVDLRGERVFSQIWKAQVGRVSLYLMDTNVPENQPASRQLTNKLYGGDLETRVRQEYLLGIGGIRALEALGLKPKVIHMNEGHSAFAGLERIANFNGQAPAVLRGGHGTRGLELDLHHPYAGAGRQRPVPAGSHPGLLRGLRPAAGAGLQGAAGPWPGGSAQ